MSVFQVFLWDFPVGDPVDEQAIAEVMLLNWKEDLPPAFAIFRPEGIMYFRQDPHAPETYRRPIIGEFTEELLTQYRNEASKLMSIRSSKSDKGESK